MNIYSFMALTIVWCVCGWTNNLFIALIATFFILSAGETECECNEVEEFELTDEDWGVFDEPAPTITAGPVFPEDQVGDKHVHYLEEPDTVGIFTYDRQNMTWTLVGNMPYKDGQEPSAVATVVLEK